LALPSLEAACGTRGSNPHQLPDSFAGLPLGHCPVRNIEIALPYLCLILSNFFSR
jgi:hypothetical protein